MKVSPSALFCLSFFALAHSSQISAFLHHRPLKRNWSQSKYAKGAKLEFLGASSPDPFSLRRGGEILAAAEPEERGDAEVAPSSIVPATAGPGDATRRNVLLGSAALPLTPNPLSRSNAEEAGADGAERTPLADVPMIRLRLPQAGVGREYVVVKINVNGQGPFDFMVDSGLTTELITPHLQQVLGITEGKTRITGLAAGGDTTSGSLVELSGASLCCGTFSNPDAKEFPLPPLHAVISDFPQEHLDPAHDPVEGMLGMELLALFDVDFDFPAGRLRFWKPGTAAQAAEKKGMIEIPAAVLNETLLLGIRITSAQNPADAQPIVGILDCGATFSAVNWAGAGLLGLPPKEDRNAYLSSPTIMGVGVDGRPQYLPMKSIPFTFRGDVQQDLRGKPSFAQPPKSWHPWGPVQVGIGDLPVFSELLGDGRRPYQGPAALIGLDVLSQRRVIMEAGGIDSRRRRLFVGPS